MLNRGSQGIRALTVLGSSTNWLASSQQAFVSVLESPGSDGPMPSSDALITGHSVFLSRLGSDLSGSRRHFAMEKRPSKAQKAAMTDTSDIAAQVDTADEDFTLDELASMPGNPEIPEIDRSASTPSSSSSSAQPLLDSLAINRALFREKLPKGVLTEFKVSGREALLHRPISWALFKQLEALHATSHSDGATGAAGRTDAASTSATSSGARDPAPSGPRVQVDDSRSEVVRTPFGNFVLQSGDRKDEGDKGPSAANAAASEEDPSNPFDSLPGRAAQHLLEYAQNAFGAGGKGWLVDGRTGTGKTALLVSAVQWARERGWCALYVPSGFMATGMDGWPGGFFNQFERSGTYDTPDIARRLLSELLGGNQAALERIQCKTPGAAGTLAAFVAAAISGRTEHVTSAALQVLEELRLATEVPVLAVIDDYNALYSYSVYGRWLSQNERKMILPSELRLASALRLLEGKPFARGAVLCATTRSKSVPRDLTLPLSGSDQYRSVEMPPFGRLEAKALNQHYVASGIAQRPRAEDFESLYFLSQGNGRLIRELSLDVDYCFMDGQDEGLLPGDVVKFNQVPFGCPPWGLTAPFPKDVDLRRRVVLPPSGAGQAQGQEGKPQEAEVLSDVQGMLVEERKAERQATKLKKLARGLAALGVI